MRVRGQLRASAVDADAHTIWRGRPRGNAASFREGAVTARMSFICPASQYFYPVALPHRPARPPPCHSERRLPPEACRQPQLRGSYNFMKARRAPCAYCHARRPAPRFRERVSAADAASPERRREEARRRRRVVRLPALQVGVPTMRYASARSSRCHWRRSPRPASPALSMREVEVLQR